MMISSGVKNLISSSSPFGGQSHRKCGRTVPVEFAAFAGSEAGRRALRAAGKALVGVRIGAADHDILSCPTPGHGSIEFNLCTDQHPSRWAGLQLRLVNCRPIYGHLSFYLNRQAE